MEASTTSNSANKLLITSVMADNLAEKPTSVRYTGIVRYRLHTIDWDRENCLLCGVAGCPLFRVCLSTGRRVGTSELCVISWVSAVERCPLSGVQLYI